MVLHSETAAELVRIWHLVHISHQTHEAGPIKVLVDEPLWISETPVTHFSNKYSTKNACIDLRLALHTLSVLFLHVLHLQDVNHGGTLASLSLKLHPLSLIFPWNVHTPKRYSNMFKASKCQCC